MDHFRHIYSSRAGDYHRLITPEDHEGNLLPRCNESSSCPASGYLIWAPEPRVCRFS